jgi:hypothetical protein
MEFLAAPRLHNGLEHNVRGQNVGRHKARRQNAGRAIAWPWVFFR